MAHMTIGAQEPVTVTFPPPGRPFTRADLDRMPDDGRRYELIDGVLIVSAAPRPVHQRALLNLVRTIDRTMPPGLEMLPAPLDVVLADDTVMQPDLLVAPIEDFSEIDLPTAPLLAIEVLSPSTRSIDLSVKKDRLERAGCPHYWIVDPIEPSIQAWALRDGRYAVAGNASGDAVLTVTEPFPITIIPSALVSVG